MVCFFKKRGGKKQAVVSKISENLFVVTYMFRNKLKSANLNKHEFNIFAKEWILQNQKEKLMKKEVHVLMERQTKNNHNEKGGAK